MAKMVRMIVLLTACLLILVACTAQGDGNPTPRVVHVFKWEDDYEGAATASVEERIWHADVIVRATLQSTADGVLNFRAAEYLKGTGPTTFSVRAATAGRPTQWDNQEALLFLSQGGGASGASASSFEFTDTTEWGFAGETQEYTGNLPEGYTIGSRNPVWMPASSATAAGSDARNSVPSGYDQADGTSVSLASLRQKIAWIEGGTGVAGYDDCVRSGLADIRFYRDQEAHNGTPLERGQAAASIASGEPTTVLYRWGSSDNWPAPTKYRNRWLQGEDKDLFSVQTVDADTDPSNGFGETITPARPLPAGTYRFISRTQDPVEVPCNYVSQVTGLIWDVTVTAPRGTAHEAFFDPVAIGTAVGADAANGVLDAAGFTVGGAATTIDGLKWEGGTLTLELSPAASLIGHTLDFIALDGSVALLLDGGAAAVSGGTLTWSVADQPWQAGDLLMLRIRTGSPA